MLLSSDVIRETSAKVKCVDPQHISHCARSSLMLYVVWDNDVVYGE